MYIEDRPVAEVAALLGVPAGTVKSRPTAPAACCDSPWENHDDHPERRLSAAGSSAALPARARRPGPGWTGSPPRSGGDTRAGSSARRRGCSSPGLARALVTTPSLLLPWLISTVVAFGVGALVSIGPGQPLVWLIAPGVAAVGIAFAYGPGTDPAWELSLSCAGPTGRSLFARGMAVFAVNAALGLLASTVSGAAAALTFGWLVPMTAVCALALAVSVTVQVGQRRGGRGVAA